MEQKGHDCTTGCELNSTSLKWKDGGGGWLSGRALPLQEESRQIERSSWSLLAPEPLSPTCSRRLVAAGALSSALKLARAKSGLMTTSFVHGTAGTGISRSASSLLLFS